LVGVSAFQQPTCFRGVIRSSASATSTSATSSLTRLPAVTVGSIDALTSPSTVQDSSANNKKLGAMMDLTGIALSGLKGQALSLSNDDFPKANELRAVIPADCFEPDTATSLGYLSVSMLATAACTAVGVNMLSVLSPENPLTWPIWAAYSAVTGTVAMGLWVLAHECGHGAFSKDRKLQDFVGYAIHSLMLVPYYSWQRSHAVHHQYTNHVELGETHVPERMVSQDEGSLALRNLILKTFGPETGIKVWGVQQLFMHLVVGWPAYLLIGATGGHGRGMTNHFYPNPLTEPEQPKKELFPGNWKEKVYQSDIGIAAVVAAVATWAACHGAAEVMALYGGPLLVINAWLVTYTWLQHTDVDVPHFSSDNHSFVKGALHTIDRPYDKMDPWGVIDFLHHKIGTTHVAHHFDSTIPHYKAQAATDAVKAKFPEVYMYDPTPIPEALWRVAKGCTACEKRGEAWIWNNEGVEDLL
jgi:fatty acid desaturase